MEIVVMYVSYGKYKINKKSAGNGTKLKKMVAYGWPEQENGRVVQGHLKF
jgi:hypothetical protein